MPDPDTPHPGHPVPRAWRCHCGRTVFFRNSRCLACGAPLGYDPERRRLVALEPARREGTWRRFGGGSRSPEFRRCANLDTAAGCNWLVDRRDPNALCRCCRLTRTIPDLSLAENASWWGRVETAKRRLVSSLIGLDLPVRSKVNEDPVGGVAFDLLRAPPGGPAVVTGHEDGVITLDIEEAEDATRESRRVSMHEPYRTLLGHLRHEAGHYYWDRLVRGGPWESPCRALFGDERADYAAALARHYAEGAPAGWRDAHVSAYASAHPAEDWAETWAHYLHVVDTLETAASFGLDAARVDLAYEPFDPALLVADGASPEGASAFMTFLTGWMELTGVLNELSRSMGLPDFYPFVLSATAVRKLHLVHRVVRAARREEGVPGAPASIPGTVSEGVTA